MTPGQFFLAAHEQIPSLMVDAMEQHRADLGMGSEMYEDYLHSAGLDHLIQLIQAAS
jgi:hypothetical protein